VGMVSGVAFAPSSLLKYPFGTLNRMRARRSDNHVLREEKRRATRVLDSRR
jgi:hypothetical protein